MFPSCTLPLQQHIASSWSDGAVCLNKIGVDEVCNAHCLWDNILPMVWAVYSLTWGVHDKLHPHCPYFKTPPFDCRCGQFQIKTSGCQLFLSIRIGFWAVSSVSLTKRVGLAPNFANVEFFAVIFD